MKEQVTISIESDVLAGVREKVERGEAPSLSAAIEQALPRRRRSDGLREVIKLWEAEHGPIGKEAEEWAHRELERAQRELSSLTPEP